uniref:NAD(P)-binding domain-containing protein n=1 Tax=viral metagenome TaxID=1070528 RepID=A0A6C0AYE4_9ZZZZ|tara:strand:- start:28992 stop:29621 length:630 start_codon:yes stop_codon:yes gene_type:complete
MKIFNILVILQTVDAYNLCIVGASSGLGRELIYQSLKNNNKVLALTNNPDNIKIPYRGGGLNLKDMDYKIDSKNLYIDTYDNYNKYSFDNIVFTTGAKPFENDYSDIITDNILSDDNLNVKNIVLISADGVSDSLKKSNFGIQIMNNWYLQDAYRAKNIQEELVKHYCKKNNIKPIIYRPKALSYGPNIYSIKSREKFAEEILKTICLI